MLAAVVIGLIVGALAKLFMPGKDPGGIFLTMLLGIAGAAIAGFLGRALRLYNPDEPAGFLGSIIGAMLLLFLYRTVFRRHTV